MTFLRVSLAMIVLPAVLSIPAEAQVARQPPPNRMPQIYPPAERGWMRRITNPYRPREVSSVSFQNSSRIFELMRAGQLYLSLSDAIALAIENNLDVQLERLLPEIASTDVERAKGGGFLRGLSLLVNEPPPGIGGPSGPLLTSLTSGSTPAPLVNSNFSDIALISQQQNDLSVTGPIPFSPGPLIPQYDPTISTLLNWTHQSTSEFTAVLTGSNFLNTNTTNGNLAFLQGFSPGTQISVTFDNSRFNSNARTFTYNPVYSSSLALTITQPLLRGFGTALNRRFIRIAKQSQRIADLVFRQQVIDTVAGVARLYTDLVSLNEDVKVKEEQLRLAERLYEDNKNKVDEGTLAPIEMTRAQAQVAVSRQALISAQGLVQQQELIVKNIITRTGLLDSAIRESHIVVIDSVTVPQKELDEPVQELFVEALRNRPDLNQAGIQVDNAQISLKGSLNALRPELDLVSTMQNSSLNGDLNPLAGQVLPGATVAVGGYGTTLEQIVLRNHPAYGIGLQLTLPLRNRVAQADATRDELQLRQTEVRRKQLENQVRLEVADALVAMQSARAAYEASVQSRILQEESVKVELQKFEVGVSTNYLVIQFQSFLAQARSTELAAKGAYAKARIALERALGRTLDVNRVSINEAYRGQVTRAPQSIPNR